MSNARIGLAHCPSPIVSTMCGQICRIGISHTDVRTNLLRDVIRTLALECAEGTYTNSQQDLLKMYHPSNVTAACKQQIRRQRGDLVHSLANQESLCNPTCHTIDSIHHRTTQSPTSSPGPTQNKPDCLPVNRELPMVETSPTVKRPRRWWNVAFTWCNSNFDNWSNSKKHTQHNGRHELEQLSNALVLQPTHR